MTDILDLIGNTPLVRLERMDAQPVRALRQARKSESGRVHQGPHRPLHDGGGGTRGQAQSRAAPSSRRQRATPGWRSRSSPCCKGYRLLLVVPDKMSQEKIFHLRAMGAEVVMTRSDVVHGHPEYYQDMAAQAGARDARRVLRRPVRQSRQSASARAHHGTRDLGADGAPCRRGRLRRRQRRHNDGAQALFRACCTTRQDGARGSRGLRACAITSRPARSARRAHGWWKA